jgi:hypothetical protein
VENVVLTLSPFQHIFIPILPQGLINFVCAPMPFLVGMLNSSRPALAGFPLDDEVDLVLFHIKFTSFLILF